MAAISMSRLTSLTSMNGSGAGGFPSFLSSTPSLSVPGFSSLSSSSYPVGATPMGFNMDGTISRGATNPVLTMISRPGTSTLGGLSMDYIGDTTTENNSQGALANHHDADFVPNVSPKDIPLVMADNVATFVMTRSPTSSIYRPVPSKCVTQRYDPSISAILSVSDVNTKLMEKKEREFYGKHTSATLFKNHVTFNGVTFKMENQGSGMKLSTRTFGYGEIINYWAACEVDLTYGDRLYFALTPCRVNMPPLSEQKLEVGPGEKWIWQLVPRVAKYQKRNLQESELVDVYPDVVGSEIFVGVYRELKRRPTANGNEPRDVMVNRYLHSSRQVDHSTIARDLGTLIVHVNHDIT